MGEDDAETVTVDELVEYCRTQAGLLSGAVETMGAEADELLDEIDDEMAEIRTRLEGRSDAVTEPESPSSAAAPGGQDPDLDIAAIEELEADLEEKQTIVEAKQVRMKAFQELASAYTELATELQRDADDGQAALERLVQFEADRDAPAYFPDRQTLLEAAVAEPEPDEGA
ncbi:hypothetical protein [Halostagnicola bangensis]